MTAAKGDATAGVARDRTMVSAHEGACAERREERQAGLSECSTAA